MADTDWAQVAQNIHVELAVRNMTRKQLAGDIGLSVSTLRRRMYGQQDWSYPELEAVAGVFHVSVDQLLQGEMR